MTDFVNKVILCGKLVAAPELISFKTDSKVLKFRLVTETHSRGNTYSEYHRITVWDRTAQKALDGAHAGCMVEVEGKLKTSSYEKNGEKRYSTEIVANRVGVSKPIPLEQRVMPEWETPIEGMPPRYKYQNMDAPPDDDLPF
jgi:single-strand DNA-binding protein